MSSLHPSELDSAATDSVASSPRSDIHPTHDPRVRLMCSFGGKILPRPHDNQLRYVGGDTRIVAVHRATSFSTLLAKLSKLSGIPNVSVKYQLPNEELDALISVTTDEDVENMLEEYDRVAHNQNPRSARLRLFLFSTDGEDSRSSSISSLLDGSANRENWFVDALNSGTRLERLQSEASSIISDVPDYLFGFDNSDENNTTTHHHHHPGPREPKIKARPVLNDNASASDPGSPAPAVSSPYCSTSSAVPSIPDLPPVRTKPDYPEPVLQTKPVAVEPPAPQPPMHYVPDSRYPVQQFPVYLVQTGAGNVPVQIRAPSYVPQYQVSTGQVPVVYHHQGVPGMGQVYGGPNVRPVMGLDPYEAGRVGVVQEGVNPQVYYGVRNPSAGGGLVMPGGGEELQWGGLDPKSGRVSQ